MNKKQIKHFFIIFFLIYKNTTGYYQKNKERFRVEASKRHRNLSEEQKSKYRERLMKDMKFSLSKKNK